MTGKRPTITDVAAQAGVSKATVSAVLNDTGAVKGATRERVLDAITRLNYRPTQGGGRAVMRNGRSIGLLIKEHDNPYYAQVADGVRACADAHGYTLLIVSTGGDYETERRAVELLRAKDVDGLIVTPVLDEHADLSHFFDLKRRNFPFVFLEEVRGVPASLVDVDNASAACRAVEYLIARGHTRIVHFAGPGYSAHSAERVQGVRNAYSASHLVFADDVVVPAGAHLEDGYRAAFARFRDAPAATRPTAATCYNDLVAIGVCRALSELGLRVPDDVSVIGFDDIPLCQYVPVPLTTVRMPAAEMGEIATQMLIRQIESRESVTPQRVYLDATLVERASTTARAGADGSTPGRHHPPTNTPRPLAARP